MRELNGDELRRRADAGDTLNAHEALYERLYWALQYWGADGQEGDDAARAMIAAFVEETYKSERDVIARELADQMRAWADSKPDRTHVERGTALVLARLIDPWPDVKELPEEWRDIARGEWCFVTGDDGKPVGFINLDPDKEVGK